MDETKKNHRKRRRFYIRFGLNIESYLNILTVANDHDYQLKKDKIVLDLNYIYRNHPSKHICTTSAQRLRRWSNIVQILYKCFVFTEMLALFL